MKSLLHIYIHIPFCLSKCPYCAFKSGVFSKKVRTLYIRSLCREISYRLSRLKNSKIATLYIGGGTPNILSINELKKILNAVLSEGSLDKLAEISIELNPRLISKDYVTKLLSIGFNRFSVGIQSFNNRLLNFLKRKYDSKKEKQKILILKECGVENFSLDLMMAIPGQSLKQVLTDIKTALRFEPKHLSCYLFTYEDESEFGKNLVRDLHSKSDEFMPVKYYKQVCRELDKNNFIHYEISNWAKKGFECKHNLAFWQGKNYMGFGLSATSFFDHVHTKNTSNLKIYLKNPFFIEERFPCKTRKQKQIDKIIRQTRILQGIERNLFAEKKIKELVKEKLVVFKDRSLRLTPKGWLLNDQIIEELIEALEKDAFPS